jgi:preprotein translocase subunit SecD
VRNVVPNRFLLSLIAIACSSPRQQRPPDWSQVPVSVEMALAQGAPGQGLLPSIVYGQGHTVYLDPHARIGSADIARVEATKAMTGTGLVLDVWLTKSGAKRLAELTGKHIGDSLAVLVDSVVLSVPPILDTINIGNRLPNPFSVGVPMPYEDARKVAAAVAKTWPARR